MGELKVSVGPRPSRFASSAVMAGGAKLVEIDAGPAALVWLSASEVHALARLLAEHPAIAWVHLSWAGVENVLDAGLVTEDRVWTSSAGAFGDVIAEHGMALALAGLRGLHRRVRATTWGPASGSTLYGKRVVILGGGGTAHALIELLRPFNTRITVVRRRAARLSGAHETVTVDRLHEVLPEADVVFLVLALTETTKAIIGRAELKLMHEQAWLVNLARGEHIVTEDLERVLRAGSIGGAALDVTDPEPLPAGHSLWTAPNLIVTPHTANPPTLARTRIAARISENIRRYLAGEELLARIDPIQGY